MNDTTSSTPTPQNDDWLLPVDAGDSTGFSDPYLAGPAPHRRQWLASGGLLAAGAMAGVAIALAAGHGGSSGTTLAPTASVPAGQSNGQVQPGLPPAGAFPGGGDDGADDGSDAQFAPGGGLPGEQRLQGTLTRVGASTITIRTSTGTSTYRVNQTTQIVRNGADVGLGALKPGDPVQVHVYPSADGGSMLVERVFAGGSTT